MTIKTLPSEPRRFQMFIGGRQTDGVSGETMTRRSPGHGVPVATWPAHAESDAWRRRFPPWLR